MLKSWLSLLLTFLFIFQASSPTNATNKRQVQISRSAKTSFKNLFGLKMPRRQSQKKRNNLKKSIVNREKDGMLPYYICGGSYKDIGHINEYQAHHLITAAFANKNPKIISCNCCPAILISKTLHLCTGSFGSKSKKYSQKEAEIFNKEYKKSNSKKQALMKVLDFGIEDLCNALKQVTDNKNISININSSPFVNARNSISNLPATPTVNSNSDVQTTDYSNNSLNIDYSSESNSLNGNDKNIYTNSQAINYNYQEETPSSFGLTGRDQLNNLIDLATPPPPYPPTPSITKFSNNG